METDLILLIVILIFSFISLICFNKIDYFGNEDQKFFQVAHAGGIYKNKLYQNNMEAITHNYNQGFTYFEIDLLYHNDKIVITHDEEKLKESKNVPKFSEIVSFVRKTKTYFLLDIKNEFKKILGLVNSETKELSKFFIIQVYCLDDIKNLNPLVNKTIVIANWKYNPSFEEIKEMVVYSKNKGINILGTSIWSETTKYYSKTEKYYKFYKSEGIPIIIHGEMTKPETIIKAKNDGYSVFSQTSFIGSLEN